MIVVVLLSILSTCFISALFGIGFYFIATDLAFAAFWVACGVQFLVFHPINKGMTIKSNKSELEKLNALVKIAEIESKQTTILECSYCGEENGVLIDINLDNEFECVKCENKNIVKLQYSTMRSTEPLIADAYSGKKSVYDDMESIISSEEDEG